MKASSFFSPCVTVAPSPAVIFGGSFAVTVSAFVISLVAAASEILLAAAAVPILNVAFLCSGGALCVNVFQVGVVVRVRAAVAFFANLTDRLSYAGCFAAGVVADFLVAVVADVIVICILVFGSGLAANIADMVFICIFMQAHISALAAPPSAHSWFSLGMFTVPQQLHFSRG